MDENRTLPPNCPNWAVTLWDKSQRKRRKGLLWFRFLLCGYFAARCSSSVGIKCLLFCCWYCLFSVWFLLWIVSFYLIKNYIKCLSYFRCLYQVNQWIVWIGALLYYLMNHTGGVGVALIGWQWSNSRSNLSQPEDIRVKLLSPFLKISPLCK